MSLITAISHSLTGIKALQSDIQVVSSNVTNAQREDYTRKSISLSANVTTAEGTGGVRVLGYTRAESSNVTRLLQESLANDGYYGTQSEYLNRVQVLLGSTQDNPVLTNAMAAFATAWRELGAAPEDATRKQNVVFTAQNLVREVNRLTVGIDKIEQEIKNDVDSSVDTLNSAISRIHELNNEIVTAQSSGQSVVDLMDLRDVEVRKVAELMKIQVFERDQNRIALYTPSGFSLLDRTPNEFTWDGSTISLGSTDVTGNLADGKLEALIGLLDQTGGATPLADPGKALIYKIETQLNSIVTLFTSTTSPNTFAAAYNGATSATGELASGFFTGTTRNDFAVATALTNGTSTVKSAAGSVIAADMDVTTRSITSGGITLTGASYTSFTDAIIYTQSQNAGQVEGQAKIYETQKDDYKKRLQNEVGVNVDEEVVRLSQLQNNYSATARVISTIKQMLDLLDSIF